MGIFALAKVSGLVFPGLALAASAVTAADIPITPDDAPIRPYADGAGPTAIFRLGRLEDRHEDVFGVVDPIRWRIQYYTLADWTLNPQAASFRDRWKQVASCRLAPMFRLWRLHDFPRSVVIQSQPEVPSGAFLFARGSSPAPLTFRKVVLNADAASLEAIADGNATASDAIPAKPCAAGAAGDGSAVFAKADATADVSGGGDVPFSVLRHAAAASAPFARAPVRLEHRGRFLSSAQELEDGVTVSSGRPIRHFLVTTRTKVPGFVSTETLLLRRGEGGQSNGAMVINLGLNRVKLGQRPVAVSSKGEVLVLGAPDHGGFRVHRCTYLLQPGATSQCKVEEATEGAVAAIGPVEPVAAGSSTLREAPMWRTAFDYSQREFVIDADSLPEECRPLVGTCKVAGITWTPLPELRGGRSGLVIRRGFPYGQMSGDLRPATLKAGAIDPTLGTPVRVTGMDGGKLVVFGDIYNDGTIRDPTRTRVFGIDCSSFLALLWGLSGNWETAGFIKKANEGGSSIRRIAGLDETSIGDAFVINIKDEKGVNYINHIVLFREARDAGPSDKSRAMLVVEFNGSCAGVCWSFYDESFLNGWAILRHEPARRDGRIVVPIPTKGIDWRPHFTS